jgi:DNA-binding transcriptional ArsR family regulator
MKVETPLSRKEMARLRQRLERARDIEDAAELMRLAGSATRLKLLYLLESLKEVSVGDLAERLGVSVSAISQHLSKLKGHGLVGSRREAQTIYYRLAEHGFNAQLRESFFRGFEPSGDRHASELYASLPGDDDTTYRSRRRPRRFSLRRFQV